MDINNLVGSVFPVYEIKDGMLYQIKTSLQIAPSKTIAIYLEKKDNTIKIFDNKQVFVFLQRIFDFKAIDVQTCLRSVLQVNGVSMSKGDLFIVTDETNFAKRFMDFLVCVGQLVKMYAFFDKT